MPPRLVNYIFGRLMAEYASGPKSRGRPAHTNETRNFRIGWAVIAAQRNYGLRPTRNVASDTDSACSIVQKALETRGLALSESAVEKIWQDLGQQRPELFKSVCNK